MSKTVYYATIILIGGLIGIVLASVGIKVPDIMFFVIALPLNYVSASYFAQYIKEPPC